MAAATRRGRFGEYNYRCACIAQLVEQLTLNKLFLVADRIGRGGPGRRWISLNARSSVAQPRTRRPTLTRRAEWSNRRGGSPAPFPAAAAISVQLTDGRCCPTGYHADGATGAATNPQAVATHPRRRRQQADARRIAARPRPGPDATPPPPASSSAASPTGPCPAE